jgi:NitT/TauT family transport system substrate-binding protein
MIRTTISRSRAVRLALTPLLAAFPVPAIAQAPKVLRVAATANDTFAEAYYAQDAGIFRSAGLNVELATFTNGQQVATAVTTGTADIGVSNPVSVVQAVQHGVPLVCVAAAAEYVVDVPGTALFVAKDAPFRTAKDLEGRTVALGSLKDLSTAGVAAWFGASGIDMAAAVKVVEVPFSEMGAALARGTVQAASIPEPYQSAAKSEIRLLANYFDALGVKRFMLCMWVATPAFVEQNRELAGRFARSIYTTAKWANSHHGETAAILSKYSRIDVAVTSGMTRSVYAESLIPAELQPVLDLAYRYKLITGPMRATELMAKL